jgi:hypothetical protein
LKEIVERYKVQKSYEELVPEVIKPTVKPIDSEKENK